MRPDELLSAYGSLRNDFDAGRSSHDDLVKACAALMAEDAEGRWWTVDATGRVLAFDAARNEWVAAALPGAEPRHAPAPPPQTPAPEAAPVERRTRHRAAKPAETVAAPPVAAAFAAPGMLAAPVRVAGRKVPRAEAAPAAPVASPPEQAAPSQQSTAVMFAVVFGASFLLSWIGWDILGIVPQAINAVIPTGSCTSFAPASIGMYFCSALVGLRVVFGSLVLAVAMLILRKPITAVVNLVNRAVPPQFRSVLPAVVAAGFFAVVWSGSHASTGHLWGILPHRAFPAVVGLFVQITMVWGPGFMARHATFFDARDRLPKIFRWGLVILVPMAVSLFITAEQRVSNEAFKQQFVVLVGMIAAYVIMTPKSGKLSDLRADLGAELEAAKARGSKMG